MRRHERKRDAKVTREGDPEGYSSEKTALGRPMVLRYQQATLIRAKRQVRVGTPESQAATSFTRCFYGNPGDGMDRRESETPIVAAKSGNADGAKGRRFGKAGRGNMP